MDQVGAFADTYAQPGADGGTRCATDARNTGSSKSVFRPLKVGVFEVASSTAPEP